MKKLMLFTLVAFFAGNMAVMSQNHRHHPNNGERTEMKRERISAEQRAERMAKQLELTNDERMKVQALFEKQDKEREKEMAEMQKQREEKQAKAKAKKEKQDAELQKIIGKKKFEQLQARRAENQDNMRQKEMHKKHPAKKGDRKDCYNS
ncbi:hypothetical protein D0T49_11165 [Paludibacter sp. 221]|uniref:hypothetical protein n=1 Tax=Paludibacter sp. 221 TaxID=2302939 RepID=UPI0013D4F788|nr:hypothetical protein [Paludibacter sp. 221]NDV47607.1 hypothetical protein [Paludibacter sp. 221]